MIAIVFLAVGLGLAAYEIGYQRIYVEPLAEEQLNQFKQMTCEELGVYNEPMWSPENSQWIRDKLKACKSG